MGVSVLLQSVRVKLHISDTVRAFIQNVLPLNTTPGSAPRHVSRHPGSSVTEINPDDDESYSKHFRFQPADGC